MTQPDNTRMHTSGTGRAEWWTGIVETYLTPVYRFVASRVQGGSVDDLVQETFLAAARTADRFDHSREVWPWLVTIARRKIADHYRRTGRSEALAGSLTWLAGEDGAVERAIVDESPLPEEICQRAEFAALARAALAAVEPSHRDCLVARYYEDLSLEEVAERLGLTRSAANSLLYRARAELRQAFLNLAGRGTTAEDCGP